MGKILILGTYPISRPLHGGQLRAESIVRYYRSQLGDKNVKYVAVYNPLAYKDHSWHDIAVSEVTLKKIEQSNYAEDIYCGLALADDDRVKNQIMKVLNSFRPDMIQLEQGYSYLGLKQIIPLLDYSIVYSSHNIEHELKYSIYDTLGLSKEKKNELIELIKKNEIELSKVSKYVIAVSDDDALKLKKLGAKKIIVAPNGVSIKRASRRKLENWRKIFQADGVVHKFVFVGSAHWPNAQGFWELVAQRPGYLPGNSKVYVVGGVCKLLEEMIKNNNGINSLVFNQRIKLLGMISDYDLSAILQLADTVLLPITQGGGSNLKTAEAILSGKKIVATTVSLRSFENFNTFPNIEVADSPKQFQSAIIKQISSDFFGYTPEQEKLVQTVRWEYCLDSLKKISEDING